MNRSDTARAPKSGEHEDQIAPSEQVASIATSACGAFGTSAATRSPAPTPCATNIERTDATAARSCAQLSVSDSPSSRAKTIATASAATSHGGNSACSA